MTYWIIHITILGLLSFVAFRFLKSEYPVYVFWAAWALKLIAGIVLGLIFFEYYKIGDTITFFELAKPEATTNIKNQPRTEFFILLLRPLLWATGGSYWITSLWLSFVSFIASWFATIIFSKLYPSIKNLIAVCFLFIPSVVFWSSGILKDSLAFASVIALIAISVKLYKQSKPSVFDILILILGVFMLFKIKHYLLITYLLFGGFLFASLIHRKIQGKIKWVLSILIIIIAIGSTQIVHPYLKIDRLPWTLYENNRAINQGSTNQLDIIIEDETWFAVMKEIPTAIHAGLFRPSILDHTPIWGWIHKIENLILTALIFMSILISIKTRLKYDWVLLGAGLGCILLLATTLPLAAPNLGTLVRYKNVFMPFLFLISGVLPYRYFSSQSEE